MESVFNFKTIVLMLARFRYNPSLPDKWGAIDPRLASIDQDYCKINESV